MFTFIQDLTVYATVRGDNDEITDPLVGFSVLKPLLSLSMMRHFSFENEYPISLEDCHIEKIARAWPALESFSFCNDIRFSEVQTKLTLSCLLSFAELCQNIDTLTLAVNACCFPPLRPKDNTIFAQEEIDFNAAFSPINDPIMVAFFLADIIPLSGTVTCEMGNDWASMNSPRVKMWEDVADVIGMVRKSNARAVRRAAEAEVSDRDSSSDSD
ncbi:hypothetical protein SISSUDRAFT_1046608, partial [Sistotremastrum suecicum HHB10207 ss-3]